MNHLKRVVSVVSALALAFTLSAPAFAAESDTGFADVTADAWYADAAVYCRDNGLMSGTSNTTFSPNTPMTRAMLSTVLYRLAGSPAVTGTDSFTDTTDNQWYSDAVVWAAQNGIVSGYGGDLFGTNDPVTREQIATILWRYSGSPAADAGTDFADEGSIATWADTAVDWARRNGYVNGMDGNRFAPSDTATRAQVATILMRYDQDNQTTEPEPTPDTSDDASEGTNVLVAYFSRYGNTDYDEDVDATTSASIVAGDGEQMGTTEVVARMIADETGGDLHLIQTAESYPTDFDDVVDENHQEQADDARPELSSDLDLTEYDVIFIGYPVWASTTPTPVLTFLESADLSGKIVIPFCTHAGYGAGSSYSAVAQSCPGADVREGLAVSDSEAASAQNAVLNWLHSLNLPEDFGTQFPHDPLSATAIRITVNGQELEGVLYDSDMAEQFIAQLPQTIPMSNYGGREVYGSIDQEISVTGEGQLYFADGDITYCPTNNTAAIFYSQSNNPNLTMKVYPIGKVTSDLSIFPDLPSRVDITFEIAE